MTPLRTAQAIVEWGGYRTAEIFASSGTFTTPAGVENALVFVIGGGGGGGGTSSTSDGGRGGFGGVAVGSIAVSGSMSVTVGAGGAGTNSAAAGSAGGTSSFSSLSATGGGGGAAGGGEYGANGEGTVVSFGTNTSFVGIAASFPGILDVLKALIKPTERPRAIGSTAALAFSLGGNFAPGAQGIGESDSAAVDATGGVGGAVIICY